MRWLSTQSALCTPPRRRTVTEKRGGLEEWECGGARPRQATLQLATAGFARSVGVAASCRLSLRRSSPGRLGARECCDVQSRSRRASAFTPRSRISSTPVHEMNRDSCQEIRTIKLIKGWNIKCLRAHDEIRRGSPGNPRAKHVHLCHSGFEIETVARLRPTSALWARPPWSRSSTSR